MTLPGKQKKFPYWLAQIIFWGSWMGFSVLMYATFGTLRSSGVTIPVLLMSLCLPASHCLRLIYIRYAMHLSLPALVLNLLWVLPLTALLVQSVMYVILTQVVTWLPALVNGFIPYQWSYFFVYVTNSTLDFLVWSVAYLMVSQFRRRQQTQTAYWQSQAQLKESELQFLHSQINSHFLFNAINNLRALIREDPERAREGLSQLGDILRAVLQSESKKKITVGDELKLVRAYVAIESLQLESRLQQQWQIDDRCLDADIPPLSIQTLVENAISHGIANRSEGGELKVIVRLAGNLVEVLVSNPVGVNPASRSGNGIGLANARKRLSALFGDKAALQLQEYNNIMEARITIPL